MSTPTSAPGGAAPGVESTGPDAWWASWWSTFRDWPPAARWASYVAAGLVLLLVVVAVAGVAVARRPLPQTSGELEVPGLAGRVEVVRDEHGHPAAVRRLPRRPDARAGLRAGPGALLRDGPAPARHGRAALRAVRRGDARDRPGDPHDGLAPGGRARAGADRAADPAGARGLRRRGERLPRRARFERAGRGVLPPAARRARLHARGLDAGRLAGVAQGDGVGPARQHAGRDRPGAGGGRPHRRRGRPALPAVPVRRAPADRRPRERWSTGSSTRTRPAAPATRSGRRRPTVRPWRRSATRSRTCRAWWGAATGSAATPGWSGRSGPPPGERCWPTTRTSASPCRGSGCRWGCTAARSRRSARWTSRASRSPGSRA